MFLFQCDFFPDCSQADIEDFVDTWLHPFLAALDRMGSIVERPWHVGQLGGRVRLFCMAPTEDALEAHRHSRDASACFARLVERSRQPPSFLLLGEAVGMPRCCSCQNSTWYILFTTFVSESSPVRCGDCGLPVPLYRLTLPEGDDEPGSIRRWAATYQACDTLFMLSGPGERFGYRQMARLDSPVTRMGREVCEAMADRMGRPWYYYLHR